MRDEIVFWPDYRLTRVRALTCRVFVFVSHICSIARAFFTSLWCSRRELLRHARAPAPPASIPTSSSSSATRRARRQVLLELSSRNSRNLMDKMTTRWQHSLHRSPCRSTRRSVSSIRSGRAGLSRLQLDDSTVEDLQNLLSLLDRHLLILQAFRRPRIPRLPGKLDRAIYLVLSRLHARAWDPMCTHTCTRTYHGTPCSGQSNLDTWTT